MKRDSLEELETEIIQVQQSTKTLSPAFIRLHDWMRMHSPLYYRWHLMGASKPVHWTLFTFFCVVFGVFFGGFLIVFFVVQGYIYGSGFGLLEKVVQDSLPHLPR